MRETIISFIGGGNMASSLIGGLIRAGVESHRIRVSEPSAQARSALAQHFGVAVHESSVEAVADADCVVLAVKPQVMHAVCKQLGAHLRGRDCLVLSIAAGIREPDLRRWLDFEAAIVRTMPNTPALLGAGATGLFANPNVSDAQRQLAGKIMSAAGITVWVEQENQLDAVTAVSGSGPAYFFLFMEYMQRSGAQLGLDARVARELTLQTALGAARMATEGDADPGTLRERVTSPGGTTEKAIAAFQAGGLEALVQQALEAARDRAVELGDSLALNKD